MKVQMSLFSAPRSGILKITAQEGGATIVHRFVLFHDAAVFCPRMMQDTWLITDCILRKTGKMKGTPPPVTKVTK